MCALASDDAVCYEFLNNFIFVDLWFNFFLYVCSLSCLCYDSPTRKNVDFSSGLLKNNDNDENVVSFHLLMLLLLMFSFFHWNEHFICSPIATMPQHNQQQQQQQQQRQHERRQSSIVDQRRHARVHGTRNVQRRFLRWKSRRVGARHAAVSIVHVRNSLSCKKKKF